MQQRTLAVMEDVPQVIEEIDEVVRLIPQERTQQRQHGDENRPENPECTCTKKKRNRSKSLR